MSHSAAAAGRLLSQVFLELRFSRPWHEIHSADFGPEVDLFIAVILGERILIRSLVARLEVLIKFLVLGYLVVDQVQRWLGVPFRLLEF